MSNFNLPMPNLPTPKAASGGADVSAIKLQLGQMYSARLETLGNQISQVKIAVGQQTVTQPLPQLPTNIRPGQNYQVSITTDKNGQAVISFFPQEGKAAGQSAQVMKVALSDAQIVNLLSLNKAYQAKSDGSVQTQAQIVTADGGKTTALKLPGLPGTVKLPEGLASLLKDTKSVQVALSAKNGKIELQLTLPSNIGSSKKGVDNQFKLNLPADKVIAIVKQSLTKSADMPVSVDAKGNTPSKVTLPNQQTIQLPGKVPPQTDAKVTNLNGRQLSIALTPQSAGNKPIISVAVDKAAMTTPLKQALTAPVQSQQIKVDSDGTKVVEGQKPIDGQKPIAPAVLQNIKLSGDKAVMQAGQSQIVEEPVQPSTTQAMAELQQQKQVLSKLIDPLIRLLLPKKMNWSEGLKSLDTLAKQMPDNKPMPEAEKLPELKQVLTQLRNSIPDQNTQLTDKTVANIVGQLLNFSPAKVATSPQPTPANAIANALQLLFGAKVVQTESKVTPQIIQQLTTLLKNHTGKEEKTAKGMKSLTTNLAQAEQGAGSLKSLVGLSSNIRSQQLENVEKKLEGNTQLNVTVPLKVDDEIKELQLAINEDEEQSEKDNRKTSVWQLNLTFDLGDLGRMLVSAKLKDGEVNMQLYAEKQGALNQINKFSKTLEQRLEVQGVKIKQMQSSLGKINAGEGNKKLNSLLQIKV